MSARLAAIVLAAGASSRMRSTRSKLVLQLADRALVAHVVDAALEAELAPVIVVTGHAADDVRAALAGRNVEFAHNPRARDGMGASLACGAQALDDHEIDAAFVCLGDMPGIRAEHFRGLAGTFASADDPSAICLPSYDGQRGHPVLFGRAHLPALRELRGDRGARAIVAANAASVREVAVDDPAVLADIDTPEDLTHARGDR